MAIWRYIALKCSSRTAILCTFRRCYQVIAAAYICPLFFCILNYLYFQINSKTQYETDFPAPYNVFTTEKEYQLWLLACQLLTSETAGLKNCTGRKVTLYTVEASDLVKKHSFLHKMHFWTFSVIIKLIPCFVLTFFMCWLVNVSFFPYFSKI